MANDQTTAPGRLREAISSLGRGESATLEPADLCATLHDNERMREALAIYADHKHWGCGCSDRAVADNIFYGGDGHDDGWKIAEDALNATT